MLLILISIHFIVRPCLYSFIVTSFVLKGLRRRHQIFFRVSYYSKAGIDNTCIMIKKCLRAFKNIRKTYATCVDQSYFQGGLQRIIFFVRRRGSEPYFLKITRLIELCYFIHTIWAPPPQIRAQVRMPSENVYTSVAVCSCISFPMCIVGRKEYYQIPEENLHSCNIRHVSTKSKFLFIFHLNALTISTLQC